jgi:hypothetical protein
LQQDRPNLDDLLATVQQFLEGAAAELDGVTRYHAQVSAYLLGICRREVAATMGSGGAPDDRFGKLCQDIRSGELDAAWQQTFDTVMAATAAKAAIVRPEHLAPEHQPAPPR